MDNKLYNNKIVDIFGIFLDIFLTLGVTFWCMKMYETVDKSLLLINLVLIMLLFNIYDVYHKTMRRKYTILLTVFIVVFMSVFIGAFISLIFRDVFHVYNIMFYCVELLTLFVVLSVDKLFFLAIIRKVEGAPMLLVIESDKVESSLARKIKYSYAVVYDSWYEMIDDDDENVVNRIINEELAKFNSVFISPAICEKARHKIMKAALKQNKDIYISPDVFSISILKSRLVQFDDTPALEIMPLRLSKEQKLVKRIFDFVCSAIGLVIASPIFLICAIAIKIESKGPVFYKQERLTIEGKSFLIYKFRTMVQDAEKATGAVLATEDDPRITKVGKILRLTRLDELPQLINIFDGSMSIVGPRPERPVFVNEYLKTIDNYDQRFGVKAGLTGLAQVYGNYQTQIKEKTLYDIMYIREFSYGLDLKIILLTVKTMFSKESAGGVSQSKDYQTAQHESITVHKGE